MYIAARRAIAEFAESSHSFTKGKWENWKNRCDFSLYTGGSAFPFLIFHVLQWAVLRIFLISLHVQETSHPKSARKKLGVKKYCTITHNTQSIHKILLKFSYTTESSAERRRKKRGSKKERKNKTKRLRLIARYSIISPRSQHISRAERIRKRK